MPNGGQTLLNATLIAGFILTAVLAGGRTPAPVGCAPIDPSLLAVDGLRQDTPADLGVALAWEPDAPGISDRVDSATRSRVAAAYLDAWLSWNEAYLACATTQLAASFEGAALTQVAAEVGDAARRGSRIAQADTAHLLRLQSVSPDGQVVSFLDRGARVVRVIRDQLGAELSADETLGTFEVVMARDGGRWRVRELVRTESADLGPTRPLPPPRPLPGFVGRTGKELVLDGKPFRVSGFNYFPQDSPWLDFWRVYDTAAIDRDFAFIAARGLNTVRVLLPYRQFGAPDPSPANVARLADLLDRARAHGLRVVVSLFDFRADYRPLQWATGDRQLEVLLRRFADSPTILAWDLSNEPNLAYRIGGKLTVDAWLVHTLRLAREFDPHHLLTIGWYELDAPTTLESLVDVVSFHHYSVDPGFAAAYQSLRRSIPDKPLLLEEFGRSTFNPLGFLGPFSEADQAGYVRDVLGALEGTDCSGYLAWTLHDFSIPPPISLWPEPLKPMVERHFGVLRLDGSPKPALADLKPWE